MTRIAPITSNERIASSTRLSLSRRGASRIAARPIGAFTKKTHSQPTYSVSTPPMRTPTAPPAPETAPQTASALLRSSPSANVVERIESAAGAIIAAPRP